MGARADVTDAQRAFRDASQDLASIDYTDVAIEAAGVMRGFMPSDTGRARKSVRPARADGRAVVTAGGPEAPHVPVLRANHPSRFVARTDEVMETRLRDALETEWDQIATRNGLST